MEFLPYLVGAAAVALFLLLAGLFGGSVKALVVGADGRPSTSKLQLTVWTMVIAFAYAAVFTARAMKGSYQPISDIPANVLLVLGFSATTMATAKGITVTYVNDGKVDKSSGPAQGLGALVRDDSGSTDLSKVQMLTWTGIAAVLYLYIVSRRIHATIAGGATTQGLPDIDGALMVLMGLSQGAYLGKKLVTTSTPRLTGLVPSSAAPGASVTLTGAGFGATGGGNQVTLDGSAVTVTTWQDDQIVFEVPNTQAIGNWQTGQVATVSVVSSGQPSANVLPLTIRP